MEAILGDCNGPDRAKTSNHDACGHQKPLVGPRLRDGPKGTDPNLQFHCNFLQESSASANLSAPKSRIAIRERFSPQTRASHGILQWESVLPVLIAEKIAIRWRFLITRKSHFLRP